MFVLKKTTMYGFLWKRILSKITHVRMVILVNKNFIADEQEKPRSLFSLKTEKSIDIYALANSQQWLTPLIDTSYGSASFIDVSQPAVWELKVSISGLLIRKLK